MVPEAKPGAKLWMSEPSATASFGRFGRFGTSTTLSGSGRVSMRLRASAGATGTCFGKATKPGTFTFGKVGLGGLLVVIL